MGRCSKHTWQAFDGNLPHATLPYTGCRCESLSLPLLLLLLPPLLLLLLLLPELRCLGLKCRAGQQAAQSYNRFRLLLADDDDHSDTLIYFSHQVRKRSLFAPC